MVYVLLPTAEIVISHIQAMIASAPLMDYSFQQLVRLFYLGFVSHETIRFIHIESDVRGYGNTVIWFYFLSPVCNILWMSFVLLILQVAGGFQGVLWRIRAAWQWCH